MMMKISNFLRFAIVTGGILALATSLGFVFQIPAATMTWPWPDGRLSYLFIGSIFAAVSVAMIWIGWTGEWGALPAGSLNVLVIAILACAYFFYLSANGRPELLSYGVISALATVPSAAAFVWGRKIPLSDERSTPRLVQISFGIFTASLFLAGGALVLRLPVFPWALNPDSAVIFGCIFLGDAFYFLYGLFKPLWHNAKGQLLSFLAYDLVLIVPFIQLFGAVKPELLLNLMVYVVVLVFSGALAIYYLLLNPKTRAI